jgi:hypothetical protein
MKWCAMWRMRAPSLVLAVSLAFAAVPVFDPVPAAAAERPSSPDGSGVITLVTGDSVTLRPGGGVTVAKGAGRDRVTFQTTREDGDTYVVPSDQLAGIVGGRLDRQLFDVTALARYGYRDRTPVLIQTGRTFTAAKSGAAALRTATAGTRIWLDGKREISLDHSVPQIGAPPA